MSADATQDVVFRRLQSGERAAVQEVFDGLSQSSRARRFHGAKPRLTERDLADLTTVGCGREAVVAVERATGHVVGVARYVADTTDGAEAEVAYAVVDRWQGRGLGRRLIVELGRIADWQGITRLRGVVAAGNPAALALLKHIGLVVEHEYEGGASSVVVSIRA